MRPSFAHDFHMREVKRCCGAACYGALAAHFGTESITRLETLIGGRQPYITKEGDPTPANKIRRWRDGVTLPGPSSIKALNEETKGALELDRWRNLALWELLHPDRLPRARLLDLLEQLADSAGLGPSGGGGNGFRIYTTQQVKKVRKLRSLSAFLTLLCSARLEECSPDVDEELHWFCCRSAFYIFPNVLYSHPALAYRWEALFVCIQRIFWRSLYFQMPVRRMRIEWVTWRLSVLSGSRSPPSRQLRRTTFPGRC